MESPVVRGLVAQVKGELLFRIVRRDLGVEAGCLQRDGTLGEPIMLRHFLDKISSVTVAGWCSDCNLLKSVLNAFRSSQSSTVNAVPVRPCER